jgi:phosphoglycolate phosphatase
VAVFFKSLVQMGIRAIVFDLDGTLIESNQLKYDAYFRLFPADDRHGCVIREVLSECFEQSRFIILEEILRRLVGREAPAQTQEVKVLAERYNEIVLAGAKTCPQKKGAETVLKRFAPDYKLYLSSTTPDGALKEIISFRKWTAYFCGVFGYPHEKSETLRHIIASEQYKSTQVLVVGDGESDKRSAMENGCLFVHVTEDFDLETLELTVSEA